MGTWYELFVGCSLAFSHCCATTSSFLHVPFPPLFFPFSPFFRFPVSLAAVPWRVSVPLCLRPQRESMSMRTRLCTRRSFSASGSSHETSEILVYAVENCHRLFFFFREISLTRLHHLTVRRWIDRYDDYLHILRLNYIARLQICICTSNWVIIYISVNWIRKVAAIVEFGNNRNESVRGCYLKYVWNITYKLFIRFRRIKLVSSLDQCK